MPDHKDFEDLSDHEVDKLASENSSKNPQVPAVSDINNALTEQRSDINEVLTSESSPEWNNLNPFQQWLQLFWVEKGNYKITEKGYRELSGLGQRQFQELTESINSRTKDTVKEYRTGLSKKEVETKVRSLISEAQANKLLGDQLIQPKRLSWKDQDVRIDVLKKFLAGVSHIKSIQLDDFYDNNLGGLMQSYYQSSPYEALVEFDYAYSEAEIENFSETKTFLTEKIYPWELSRVPITLWNSIKMRRAAVDWLLNKTGKSPKDIQMDDFINNRLRGLTSNYYQNSPYKALLEAGYAYSEDEIKTFSATNQFPTKKNYPWELANAPLSFWENKDMRKAAVVWLLHTTGKLPKHIQGSDFDNNGLVGLIRHHYQSSPYKALVEAGYAYSEDEIRTFSATKEFPTKKIYPWELANAPSTVWSSIDMRKATVEWLLNKTGKSPKDIQIDDFTNNGLEGLTSSHYQGSPYKALLEAGYAYSEDEISTFSATKEFPTKKIYPWEFVNAPRSFWESRGMRKAAVEWLLNKTAIPPKDLQQNDFHSNGLGGLISNHYQGSPYKALVEAGYAYSEDEISTFSATKEFPTKKIYPWELIHAPHKFWENSTMRKVAMDWLLHTTSKSPKDLQLNDFHANSLGGLTLYYYQNSPYKALVEAGYAWSFEEIINQSRSNIFSLNKLYPWQVKAAPNYQDQITNEIVTQWHAWYKQQNNS